MIWLALRLRFCLRPCMFLQRSFKSTLLLSFSCSPKCLLIIVHLYLCSENSSIPLRRHVVSSSVHCLLSSLARLPFCCMCCVVCCVFSGGLLGGCVIGNATATDELFFWHLASNTCQRADGALGCWGCAGTATHESTSFKQGILLLRKNPARNVCG